MTIVYVGLCVQMLKPAYIYCSAPKQFAFAELETHIKTIVFYKVHKNMNNSTLLLLLNQLSVTDVKTCIHIVTLKLVHI